MYACSILQENGESVRDLSIEYTHFLAVTELCKKDLADHLKHDGHNLSLFDRLLLGRDICRG
jgi:hypothetical protein